MIKIKTVDDNKYGTVKVNISKDTPYTTLLLGAEVLVEQLIKYAPNNDIDWVLDDIKRVYMRDKDGKEKNSKIN